MKQIYTLALCALSMSAFAQTTISFEESEGYSLGTINTQKGWEVAESQGGGFIENQIITDEKASEGLYSFKNSHEPTYNEQWFPIFGGAYEFSEPIDYKNFSFSYDVLVTEQGGADFEFVAFSINDLDEYTPIVGIGIENRGDFYLTKDEDYDFEPVQGPWQVGEWMNIKLVGVDNKITFYLNGVEKAEIPAFGTSDILGINILHNNYGGSAYYDNLIIKSPFDLAVGNIKGENNLTVYPNPASESITVSAPEAIQFSSIAILDINGKVVIEGTVKEINIKALPAGTYTAKATTVDGKVMVRKIVKK